MKIAPGQNDEKISVVDPTETMAGESRIEVASCAPGWIHLRVPPKLGLRDNLNCFIRDFISDLPTQLCEELCLAMDELLSNSIEHGCQQEARCRVDVKIIRTPRLIMFHVKDPGNGFSVDEMTHAAVNNPPEEPLRHTQLRHELGMRPGGFGIMLVKRIADELIYNQKGNEVILLKYLDRP